MAPRVAAGAVALCRPSFAQGLTKVLVVEGSTSDGDRTEKWRAGYATARKDVLRDDARTNRRRLRRLGADHLLGRPRWVDLGCGDGNVGATIRSLGVEQVVSVDYQPELLGQAAGDRLLATATELPIRRASVDVVLAMDVLHHLPRCALAAVCEEVRRVLRPGGSFLICEPANTLVRRVLTPLLLSPLVGLSRHASAKRSMVEAEWDTLAPWLQHEGTFLDDVAALGFQVCRSWRGGIHSGAHLVREASRPPGGPSCRPVP